MLHAAAAAACCKQQLHAACKQQLHAACGSPFLGGQSPVPGTPADGFTADFLLLCN